MKRRPFIRILAITVPMLVILYFAIGLFFYHFALSANATQSRSVGEKHYIPSPAIDTVREEQERARDREFLQAMTPEIVTVTSHDDLALQGYVYEQPKKTNNWVFAVHGYTGSARQMTRWNRQLYELGYNVFAPDLRGHGESEGDYYGMGWLDQPDLKLWLEQLVMRYPDAKITLYGVSMGASAVLNMASAELPPQVKAVIADSGFTSVASIFETQLHTIFHLPSFPIMNAANTVANWRIDLDLYGASTVAHVPSITRPILYIHGGQDTFVPVENVYALAEATTAVYSILIVEEATHGEAVKVAPDIYRNKLHTFIQQHHQ